MSDPSPFKIEHDAPNDIWTLLLSGYWTLADVDAYRRAIDDIFAKRRGRGAKLIIDLRALGVQSKDVTQALQVHREARDNAPGAEDVIIAIVQSESALMTLQARRLVSEPLSRNFFSDPEAAHSWLKAEPIR